MRTYILSCVSEVILHVPSGKHGGKEMDESQFDVAADGTFFSTLLGVDGAPSFFDCLSDVYGVLRSFATLSLFFGSESGTSVCFSCVVVFRTVVCSHMKEIGTVGKTALLNDMLV